MTSGVMFKTAPKLLRHPDILEVPRRQALDPRRFSKHSTVPLEAKWTVAIEILHEAKVFNLLMILLRALEMGRWRMNLNLNRMNRMKPRFPADRAHGGCTIHVVGNYKIRLGAMHYRNLSHNRMHAKGSIRCNWCLRIGNAIEHVATQHVSANQTRNPTCCDT